MNQVPSMGRVVLYQHSGSADGKYPPMFSPAIVQKVNEDGSCNLIVFANSDGIFFPKNVLELKEGDKRTGWMWPPRV
jgi:hypothetical protein